MCENAFLHDQDVFETKAFPAMDELTLRQKKILYVVSAAVGLALVIGTAATFTVLLGASAPMIPFVVGMWSSIIWAATIVIQNYKAVGSGPPDKTN